MRERYEKPLVSQIENTYHPENKTLSKSHMQIIGNNFLDKFTIPKGYEESTAEDFVNVLILLAEHNLLLEMDEYRTIRKINQRIDRFMSDGQKLIFCFWPIGTKKLTNNVFLLKGKIVTYKTPFNNQTRMDVGDSIEHVNTADNIELKWDLFDMYPTVPIGDNNVLQIRPVVYMSYQLYLANVF
uniref:Uncharacterized protein n=1 Tax=Marseillevirus LCMAC101 TaxID=2506602 RepID=A0A481YSL6_9VIRU|nr:MAG: hypothetical protein LCMAC101_00630 [Marseillevirus LCMAC101]